MSVDVTFNGVIYTVPETGETGWGGNTTSYLVAIAAGALQKTGGSFTLAADVDFGASFGLKSLNYTSRHANSASTGVFRLGNTESITWRNATNTANLSLFVNASDLLRYGNGTVYTLGAGSLVNLDIQAAAGIVYSKLNLSLSIVNADIQAAAGIVHSKLNLINGIVDVDINSAAGIALTKLATATVDRLPRFDASGFLIASNWAFDGSNQLTTGSQKEFRFQDGTTNYVSIAAPVAVTTHGYLLPIAQATAGQVLLNDGAGQLSWGDLTGGGTVNLGISGRLAYYPAAGTLVDDTSAITTDGSTWARFASGSVTVPGIGFNAQPGTGFFQTFNALHISTEGGERAIFSSAGLTLPAGNLILNGPVLLNVGGFRYTLFPVAPAADRVYGIRDAGANADFVMTAGAQTLAGIKTFSSNIVGHADQDATTELDNLGVTAINTSLVSSVSETYNIGSSTVLWQMIHGRNVQLGKSGVGGTLILHPGTALRGRLLMFVSDNTTDTDTQFIFAAQAAARNYTVPDAGANANFVMTAGAQTLAGIKTFTGLVRKPNQPCFLAQGPAVPTQNVTGDGTIFVIEFNTEVFDLDGNYNITTSIFTAPVAGQYHFTATIRMQGLTTGNTSSFIRLVTSGQTFVGTRYNTGGEQQPLTSYTVDGYADMAASDTAFINIQISGSTRICEAFGDGTHVYFSGSLVT